LDEKPNSPFYSALTSHFKVDLQSFLVEYTACGEDFMKGVIPNLSSRVYLVCQKLNVDISSVSVESMVNELVSLHVNNVFLYSDTIDVLNELRAHGFKLGMISNASSWSEMVLDSFGIRRFFDSIILSYRYGVVKPMPEIYIKALNDIGGDAKECYFVGDGGDHEMEGARKVGFTTVLVDRYGRKVDADFRVETLTDAMHIIIGEQRL
jgi:putative hydrolase of the HAD superfamily